MGGYNNNTPNQVYKNGTLARFNDKEWEFIKQYGTDGNANRPPSLINILGKDDGTNPSSTERPFKYVMPAVENGKIVGFGWRNPNLPGTTGPGDPSNPNRSSIDENTTSSAIDAVKNGTMTAREAMFIIRARVGMEAADVPQPPPNSKDSDLYRLDATPDRVRASYGSGKENTSFNSSNMRGQIYNQDFARQLLKKANDYTTELENGLANKTIKETFDINGQPRYIKREQIGTIYVWNLFIPDFSSILQYIDQKSLPYVMDDLNHLVSGAAVRNQNPNDNTSRGSGPTPKIFQSMIVEPSSGVGSKSSPLDVAYKGVKAGTQKYAYASIIGLFSIVALINRFYRLDPHTLHAVLDVIEKASVGAKTLKNLSRATSPSYQSWWDQISPIYSVAAPYGWYLIGHWLNAALLRRGISAVAAAWAGPAVTVVAIAMEIGYEQLKEKRKQDIADAEAKKLREDAEKGGCLPDIYVSSGGTVCIPVIYDGTSYPDVSNYDQLPVDDPRRGRSRGRVKRARIPIGVKKDKDGNPIHLKYKDIDPNSPIPNVDVPVLDKNGRPIPGSWYPVLIYPSEPIYMSGNSGNEPGIHNNLGFYTDADEDIVNSNISINTTKIESDDRTQKYRDISGINDSNGFGLLSNRDAIPYRPTGTGPERGGMSGDEPDFRSPLEKINDWNPWGDGNDNETPFSNNINTNPSDINPTENKNGAPSNSNQNILNGNSSVIVAGYPVG